MSNEYLKSLSDEYHEYYDTDRPRAEAAASQIRKISGPMTDAEESYFFGRSEPSVTDLAESLNTVEAAGVHADSGLDVLKDAAQVASE